VKEEMKGMNFKGYSYSGRFYLSKMNVFWKDNKADKKGGEVYMEATFDDGGWRSNGQ